MQTFHNIQDTAFSINQRWTRTSEVSYEDTVYKTSSFPIYQNAGPNPLPMTVFGSSTTDAHTYSTRGITSSSSQRERGNLLSSTFNRNIDATYSSFSSSSKTYPEYVKTWTNSTGPNTLVTVDGEAFSGSGILTEETNVFYQTNYTRENVLYTRSYRTFDNIEASNNSNSTTTGADFYDTNLGNYSSYSGLVSTSAGGTVFAKNTLSYTYQDTFSSISEGSLVSTTSAGTNTTIFNTISTLNIPTLTTSILSAQTAEKLGTQFFGAPGVLLMHLDFTKPNSSYSHNNIADYIKVAKSIKILETTHRNISLVTSSATSISTQTGYYGDVTTSHYLEKDYQAAPDYYGGLQDQKTGLVSFYDYINHKGNYETDYDLEYTGTYAKTISTIKTIFNSDISDSESKSTTIFNTTTTNGIFPDNFLSTTLMESGMYYSPTENTQTILSTFVNREKINLKVSSSKTLNDINYFNVITKSQTTNSNNTDPFRATYFNRHSSKTLVLGYESHTTDSLVGESPRPYKTSYFTRPRGYLPYWGYASNNSGEWIPPIPQPINLALGLNDFALTSIKNDYGHVSYLQNQTIGTDGPYYNKLEPSSFKYPLIGANYETGNCTNYAFHAVAPSQQSSYFIARFLSTNSDGTLISYSTDLNRITSLSYTDSDLENSALSSTLIKIFKEEETFNWGSYLIDGATRFTKDRGNIYYSEQSIRTSTQSNAYDTSASSSFNLTEGGNRSELIITNDLGDIVPSNLNSNFVKTTSNNERTAVFNTVYGVLNTDAGANYNYGKIQNLFNLDYFTAGGILDNGDNKSITFINKVNPELSQMEYSYFDRSNSSLVSGVSSFDQSFTTEGSRVTTYKPIGPSINSATQDQITYSAPFTLGGNIDSNFNQLVVAGGSELTTIGNAANSSFLNRKMSPNFDGLNTVVIGEIKPNVDIFGIGHASHLPAPENQNILPVGAFASSEKEAVFSTVLGSNWYLPAKYSSQQDLIYAKTAAGEDNITGTNWATTGKMFGFDSKFGNFMY